MEDDSVAASSSTSMDPTTEQAENFLSFESFSKFYEQFSLNIKETVSASTKIPLKQNELDYYMTCPAFKNFLYAQNDRCLKIISTLLRQQGIKKTNINSAKLEDDERIDMIIDSNDQIIEKLGIQLDEIQGLRKKTETELKFSTTPLQLTSRNINTSWNKDMGMVVNKSLLQQTATKLDQSNANGSPVLEIKRGPITKPQKNFADKIDNSYLPFVSKLRCKHNCLVPLPDIYKKIDDKDFEVTKETFENYPELLENPYLYEIDRIQVSDCFAEASFKIQSPASLENTPFKYIDDMEGLIWLVDHLGKNNRANVKEIAVDLEHHNYRSFLGFTCLMQISTRNDDFLVDTIKLRSEMYRLNEIFTDWTLIKVLHGADFDIEWLQKDFGIYVVNMFDTGQAARVLQYPHFSLSYLLQKFCGITAQKQYQLADWRQRPLNDAMIKYAREDTHYLLYIFDNIRDDLVKMQQKQLMSEEPGVDFSGQINLVLEKSKAICKKVYKKPTFYTKGFLNLCQHNSHLNSKQTKALRDLYEWRDKIARETDESWEYVLKNHQLLKIAELLPREIYGIFALCNPLSTIVESNVHEMLEVVKNAREFTGSLSVLTLSESTSATPVAAIKALNESQSSKSVLESIVHLTTYDPNSLINCAHDLPVDDENTGNQTMDTEQTNFLSLNEILIRPSVGKETMTMPKSLMEVKVSELTSILSKDLFVKSEAILVKKIKMLEEKVRAIKEEIENPFQMFLPDEFRQKTNGGKNNSPLQKWCLLKPLKTQPELPSNANVQAKADLALSPTEEFMIPLKKQFRSEKKLQQPSKKRKNVDFTDAIIEYNKSKSRINALGGENEEEMPNENQNVDIDSEIQEQQEKLDALLQQKISANLKLLSKESVVESSKKTAEIYSYDPVSINKLFTKPEVTRNEFDPASKIRNSKHSKVNKRRMTNAITRMKNNHSLTYKKDAPSNQGGGSSGGGSNKN